MSPHDEQSRELLAAAARDELTCRILRRDAESPVEATLFHAQQTLEKGLKAVLVSRGIVFRRTHDLLELLELAVDAMMAWARAQVGANEGNNS